MLFAVTGPSGAGKTYLIRELLNQFPDQFISPRLVTTRQPRPGNPDIDRVHVSKEEFDAMHQAGHFMLADEFQSNWYGFPMSITEPQPQQVIINVWPKSIPQFIKPTGAQIIGLDVGATDLELLRRRMLSRGDTAEIVENRMKQIKIDLSDLTQNAELVNAHGKMFKITGDDTIPEQVIPWILQAVAS